MKNNYFSRGFNYLKNPFGKRNSLEKKAKEPPKKGWKEKILPTVGILSLLGTIMMYNTCCSTEEEPVERTDYSETLNDDVEGDDDTSEYVNDDSVYLNDDADDDDSAGDDDSLGCSNKNGIYKINWILIPEGTFMMGCSPNDENCKPEESPRHPVRMSSFEMTESEITQDQFKKIMGYNPTNFEECKNCAVDGVSFEVSKDFCERIGGQLPTEAQWEYSTRAGTETIYYCGDEDSCLENIAWYDSNSGGRPHEVCGKEANDFGLYDTLGNLHEYTSDNCYEYTNEEEIDPSHPEDGMWLSLRGAGWASPAIGMRISYRHQEDPVPYDVNGLRCVKISRGKDNEK